ncbi:MAG: MFS transporter [Roseivivax sp.]|nr:MFS transporter [Roseivivax sp.]
MAVADESYAPIPEEAEPEAVSLKLALGAVGLTLFFASLGQTIVSTAMPVMVADLHGMSMITWVITAYLLASTVSAPIAGKMGDLFGRKTVLQWGLAVFTAGAILCGLAQSMPMMIAGRALQGAGAGSLIVTSMAVVADLLPPRERSRAQGVLGAAFGLSTVIGPLLGGLIVEHASWHWIFFVNLPVGVAAAAIIAIALPRRTKRRPVRLDYAGAGLLATLLASVVLASNMGGSVLPWGSPAMVGLIGLALAALVGFVLAERRAEEPILPLALFRNNVFVVVNAVGVLVGMGMFGTIALLPVYLQLVKGVSPTVSGMFLIPMMGGLIAASMVAGAIMSRTGRYKHMPTLSTAILALALLWMSALGPDTPLWTVGVAMGAMGLGLGPVFAVGVAAIQNAVPTSMLGVGTASANMFRLIGGSVGTAAFGAIFSGGMAHGLSGLLPAEMSANYRSLNAQMLAGLPDATRHAIGEAISASLHPVFWIAAAAALLASAVSVALHERPLAGR